MGASEGVAAFTVFAHHKRSNQGADKGLPYDLQDRDDWRIQEMDDADGQGPRRRSQHDQALVRQRGDGGQGDGKAIDKSSNRADSELSDLSAS